MVYQPWTPGGPASFSISDFTENLLPDFIDYSLEVQVFVLNARNGHELPISLKLKVRLTDKENGEIKDRSLYGGLAPDDGKWDLHYQWRGKSRSQPAGEIPGIYFNERFDVAGKKLFGSTIMPQSGCLVRTGNG